MRIQQRVLVFILVVLFATSCNRKTPQIIYQDKIVSTVDTVTVISRQTDTIPCDDFEVYIENEIHDTVYVKVVDKQISVRYVKLRDTIFRETIVLQPAPRKSIIKTDNSIKAKKGSIIGNDNTMTTKKGNWWWIFLSGALSWFIVQNVIWKLFKSYLPGALPTRLISGVIDKIKIFT